MLWWKSAVLWWLNLWKLYYFDYTFAMCFNTTIHSWRYTPDLILEHFCIVVVFTVVTLTREDFKKQTKKFGAKTQVQIMANFHSLPDYMTWETTFSKATAEYSAVFLYGFTHIQLKSQAEIGNCQRISVLCKVKKMEGLFPIGRISTVGWVKRGDFTVIITLGSRRSLYLSDLHFYRGLSQHVCRWITVVKRGRASCCNRDNKRDHCTL